VKENLQVVFSEEQIRKRVLELASDISRDYGDEAIHVVGILGNCFIFVADLVRQLTCPVVCHFTKMEFRDTVTGTQELRSIVYDPIAGLKGKNVLLVDVLIDSGITIDHLVQQLLLKKPKTVQTAALVDREDRRRLPFRVNYAGFSWEGGHLVGYGMEKDGLYRNLPYVAAIPTAVNATSGEGKEGGGATL